MRSWKTPGRETIRSNRMRLQEVNFKRTLPPWIVLFVCLFFFYVATLEHISELADDAFISFRYAKHLVEGKGLVFNGGERVEGYTNFLWVLLMAVGYKCGVSPPIFSRVLSAACAALLVTAVALFCRSYFSGRMFPRFSYLGALLLGMNPLFIEHIGTGLETILFALLLFLSLSLYLRIDGDRWRPYLTGSLLGLAYLTRPDAVLWTSSFVVIDVAHVALGKRPFRRQVKVTLKYGIVFSLIVLAHLAWRIGYYHDWLPNTYYAKGGVSNWYTGYFNTTDFLLSTGGIGLVALLGGPLFLRTRWAFTMSLIILVSTMHNLRVGDFILTGRFLLPILPLIYIILQELVRLALTESLSPRGVGRWQKIALVGFRTAIPILFLIGLAREYRVAKTTAERFRAHNFVFMEMAECIKENTSTEDTIALTAVGMIPYYSGRRCIDMAGLTDRHIARNGLVDKDCIVGHQRADSDYVLDRKPDVVLLPRPTSTSGLVAATRYLWGNHRFFELYEPISIECSVNLHELYFLKERGTVDLSAKPAGDSGQPLVDVPVKGLPSTLSSGTRAAVRPSNGTSD